MLGALWVADRRQLVVLVHHLAIDAVSWRILLEDLNTAWAQYQAGQPLQLPAASTSFARWASLLSAHARRPKSWTKPRRGGRWRRSRRRYRRRSRQWIPTPRRDMCRWRWMSTPHAWCWQRCPLRCTLASTRSL
ncbi:condensation domain protein [Mycobacterium xenopi 3993]|nr:condensation domain protein [Mycobacterium xenopi 3993]